MEFELEDIDKLSNFENLEKGQLFRFVDNDNDTFNFKTDDGYTSLTDGFHYLIEFFPDDIGRKVIKLEQIEPIKVREVK